MRFAAAIQGLLFAPVLVCLFFLLKAFCPESAGSSCFADQFAVPIFLPLVAVYKIFGDSSIIAGQELLLILIYWAIVGFLIGLVVDLLWGHKKQVLIASAQSYIKPIVLTPIPNKIPIVPIIIKRPEPPKAKPPINLLDREEFKS